MAHVRRNKGAPGVDGMTTDALPAHLETHWHTIENQLLAGTYRPQPVRRVEIPKPGGGVRKLGIPTVLDRVNHDILMSLVAKRETAKRLLKILSAFLTAGILEDGLLRA